MMEANKRPQITETERKVYKSNFNENDCGAEEPSFYREEPSLRFSIIEGAEVLNESVNWNDLIRTDRESVVEVVPSKKKN